MKCGANRSINDALLYRLLHQGEINMFAVIKSLFAALYFVIKADVFRQSVDCEVGDRLNSFLAKQSHFYPQYGTVNKGNCY